MTPTHAAELDERGFTVVPGVLSLAAVARLLAAFGDTTTGTGTEHVEIDDATPHADEWRSLERHPTVLELAARLVPAPRFRSHGRNPRPGFGRQGLHADAPARRRGDPISAVTAIWMLDPFTESNGSTRVVPGSHDRLGQVPRPLAAPSARHPDEVVVTGAAGDVLLFNGHLWHGGTQNRSAGPRRAVQMTALAPGIGAGVSRSG